MNFFKDEDTIVALSTPIGRGALAIIRFSGNNSLSALNRVFSREIKSSDHRKAFFGEIHKQNSTEVIDEVVAIFYRSPNSFTGEDLVEISCHCNPLIFDEIIRELTSLGLRTANPGEFTQRAFLNHKMDLTQAEAVASVIDAKTRQSLSYSMRQLEGGLSDKIQNIKQGILDVASLVEVSLDFNEDDIQVYEKADIKNKIQTIQEEISRLMKSYEYGHLLDAGIKLLILGKPNVGKSSLLNALLEKERAIVSEIPGTTRDYIEGNIHIDGIPLQIIDTAGVRETQDPIEDIGVQRAFQQASQAELILAMFEAHTELDNDDFRLIDFIKKRDLPIILVVNKVDLFKNRQSLNKLVHLDFPLIEISAKMLTNIDGLKQSIKSHFLKDAMVETEAIIITSSRHKVALKQAHDTLSSFLENLESGVEEVVLAVELRNALDHLGEIIGETTTDELLNNIFSQFCVGK
jgi:tRNA modification GTPase